MYEDFPHAPTMSTPSKATEEPKVSFAAPSEAVSSFCWLHTVPLRVKTYAAPWKEFFSYAPMTAVFPLTATE